MKAQYPATRNAAADNQFLTLGCMKALRAPPRTVRRRRQAARGSRASRMRRRVRKARPAGGPRGVHAPPAGGGTVHRARSADSRGRSGTYLKLRLPQSPDHARRRQHAGEARGVRGVMVE